MWADLEKTTSALRRGCLWVCHKALSKGHFHYLVCEVKGSRELRRRTGGGSCAVVLPDAQISHFTAKPGALPELLSRQSYFSGN